MTPRLHRHDRRSAGWRACGRRKPWENANAAGGDTLAAAVGQVGCGGAQPTVFGVLLEHRVSTLSRRARSTTPTSLRFRINELRTVQNSVAQNPPSNPAAPQIHLPSATCGLQSKDCVRNCVRPSNHARSLTAILLSRLLGETVQDPTVARSDSAGNSTRAVGWTFTHGPATDE